MDFNGNKNGIYSTFIGPYTHPYLCDDKILFYNHSFYHITVP